MELYIQSLCKKNVKIFSRSNLVGMGIIPLQYLNGSNTESNKLTGKEQISIELPAELTPGCEATVTTDTGVKFTVQVRFDTEVTFFFYNY